MKSCIYCSRIVYDTYICQCSESQIVCYSCNRKFKCESCKKQRVKVQFVQCKCCKKQFNKSITIMGIYKISWFCNKCCRQINEKKDHKYRNQIFGSHSYYGHSYSRPGSSQEKQKQVKAFLGRFCPECGQVRKQEKNGLMEGQNGFRDSRCIQCKQKQKPKIKKREEQIEKKVDSRQVSESIKKKIELEAKERERQKLINWWKTKQKLVTLRCLSCEKRLFTTQQKQALVTEDMVLCKYCSLQSKYGEEQYKISGAKQGKSEGKKNQNVIDDYDMPEPKQNSFGKSKMKEQQKIENQQKNYNSKIKEPERGKISRVRDESQEYNSLLFDVSNLIEDLPQVQKSKSSIKQFQALDISEIKDIQSKQKAKIDLSNNVSDPPLKLKQKSIVQSESRLKRITSDADLTNFKINLPITKDQQFLQCKFCTIQIEAVDSIWEEDQNAPLCKCCMADFITRSQRQAQKKQNNDRLAKTDFKQQKRLESDYKQSSQKKRDWKEDEISEGKKDISQWNEKIGYSQTQKISRTDEKDKSRKQKDFQKSQKQPQSSIGISNPNNQTQNRSKTISKQSNLLIKPTCSICKKNYISQKYSVGSSLLCLECKGLMSMKNKGINSIYHQPYSGTGPYYPYQR